MPNDAEHDGNITKRLDILISLILQDRPNTGDAKRKVGDDALFLHKFGLSYEEISKITGSTRESITELVGRHRRASEKSKSTKRAKQK